MLLAEIVTDAARSGARILQTPREVSYTIRDRSMLRDSNTDVLTDKLSIQSPNFIGTSDSSTRTGKQDIASPRRSIIEKKSRNVDPIDAAINRFTAVHGHSTPISGKVIGAKTVPIEISDVYVRERMDFTSNSAFAKIPNFMD